jgi:hypothetical protein
MLVVLHIFNAIFEMLLLNVKDQKDSYEISQYFLCYTTGNHDIGIIDELPLLLQSGINLATYPSCFEGCLQDDTCFRHVLQEFLLVQFSTYKYPFEELIEG